MNLRENAVWRVTKASIANIATSKRMFIAVVGVMLLVTVAAVITSNVNAQKPSRLIERDQNERPAPVKPTPTLASPDNTNAIPSITIDTLTSQDKSLDIPANRIDSPMNREVGPAQVRDEGATTIRADAGHITRTEVESPASYHLVKVVNHSQNTADIDFVAVDCQGIEVGRETVVVEPKFDGLFNLQNVFPNLSFDNVSVIEIQSSVRPADSESGHAKDQSLVITAAQLQIAFFSQRDSRWANNRLGTCDTTIGKEGCAITCVAMAGARSVYNFNPATLNTYLTKNGGYSSGCLVNWSVAANIDGSGGFTWIGTGSVGSAANLKALIDGNKFVIARSARFSSHFGIIYRYDGYGTKLSDFVYLDPWDLTATFRRVGDGWISATSATRIYR
jgi:hypothetical protein